MLARWLYTLIAYGLIPLIPLRLWWRARRAPAYAERWRERWGFVAEPPPGRQLIWVHAVSVGETLAAVPLIRALQARYPDAQLAVTTMTPTGSERVAAIFGNAVYHAYAPYDLPDAAARFLRRLRPALLVIMETELWPNLIHGCHQRGIPVVVANARLSAKSAAGYARIAWLSRPMLRELSAVAAQSAADGERYIALGLPPQRLQVTGNIKFDVELDERVKDKALTLGEQWRGPSRRPVWLAASTHRGEDDIVLAAFAEIRRRVPHLLLVLVPRHPERFAMVAALCREAGFEVARRSEGVVPDADCAILVGDTMGELLAFYGASDLAFVGGSLVPVGGHNLIEPAAWGVPVLSGPHLDNFVEVSQLLVEAGGLRWCADGPSLAAAVIELLENEPARQRMGAAALAVATANRGALTRLLEVIARQIW
jgi:3-deoxy-D-manno-octulosonic-acid transferase